MPLDPSKIKSRREALKLSQAEAADRAGITQPQWARLESGRNADARISTIEAVARALRCALARLLA